MRLGLNLSLDMVEGSLCRLKCLNLKHDQRINNFLIKVLVLKVLTSVKKQNSEIPFCDTQKTVSSYSWGRLVSE